MSKNFIKLAIESESYSKILKSNSNNNLIIIEENMVKEYTKSLSNVSTNSVDSGIFDVESDNNKKQSNTVSNDKKTIKEMNVGEAVKKILADAKADDRIVCGVNSSIKFLNDTENPEHTLFFFMAPTNDHSAHMSTILLKAFCFENDIYIVQLDSSEKLSRLLNIDGTSCALVQRSNIINDVYNSFETMLIDHCEDFWNEIVQPIIRLPEK